jgi:amino acid adenylation domain-containing protein
MIPLSHAQQRLWLLHQIDGPSSAYNIPMALRLRGALDRPAMREALTDVVRRHEALRTVFPVVDGQPRQRILPAASIRVDLDERGCPPDRLEKEIAATARETFDLAADPPIRARLLDAGPGDCVLVLVLHHIAADGWSLGPFCADLSAAYAARTRGQEPGWAELPLQYADYALWQREMLGSDTDPDSLLSRQLAFWSDALRGQAEEVRLPADRPRSAGSDRRNGTVHFRLDAQTHLRLGDLARQCHATLFMVVQAALATLLTRLGAGTDIPLGTPVAGRGDEALESLVGFFVNTLVLRTDTAGNPSFRDLVARVRTADLAAYAHQDLPFERLVQEINPRRSPSRHPVFQVMLVVQGPGAAPALELPGLAVAVEAVATGTAKLDLQVGLVERPDCAGLDGSIEYAADLFDHETVEVLAGRLIRLLDAAAADPGQPIGEIDILGAAERQRIAASQQGEPHPTGPATLASLVRRQAAESPDAIALTGGGTALSYAAMLDRAERLAARLAASGAAPGRRVALILPRHPDLVVAMLACHLAGAAYVPIDPDLPPGRVSYLISDSAPVAVVTTADTEVPAELPRIVVSEPMPRPEAGGTAVTPADPDDPAYVIYTSGSTGQPKGVVISQRSLAAYLSWCLENYAGLTDGSVVHTSVSYDMTVTALFGPLICGGRVELAESLAGTAAAGMVKITPSHLELLTSEATGAAPRATLIIGGEALLGEQLAGWRRGHQQVTVLNEYGPTEATVGCVVHRIGPDEPVPAGPVPIGRPIWNTGAYVLDAALQPVPDNVPGELYLAGEQLAQGYLNRLALTAERFVADPYGPPGSRMYRTGDLVRRRRDALLEYLGRSDDQVKVRGFRIETGEIESALVRHPDVEQAAVVMRTDRPGDQRLAGYLTAAAGRIDLASVRAHLARNLPAQMLPAALVTLPRLPVTPNGKLDRAALPAPQFHSTSRAARTGPEKILCELFAETLGLPRIGIDDNFFEIGGHSLLALRLSSLIRERFGADVEIRAIFAAPTVAQLATLLEPSTTGTHPGPASADDPLAPCLPFATGGRAAPVFFLPPATGVSWMYAGLTGYIGADHPVYGFQSPGLRGASADFAGIVASHLAQVRQLAPDGPGHLIGWSFGATVAHALAVALQKLGLPVGSLTLLDGYPAGWAPDPLAAGSPGATGEPQADADPARRDWTALRLLLSSIGYPASTPAQDSLSAARATGGPLAGLDDETLGRLSQAFRANAAALAHGRSGLFDGDAVLVTSADGGAAPGAWRGHVTGQIQVHQVPVSHGLMTTHEAVRQIGPILARQLGCRPR